VEEFKKALYGESYDVSSFKVTNMVGTDLPTALLKMPHVHEVIKAYENDDSLSLESFPLRESVELTLSYFILSLYRLSSFKEQMVFLDKHLEYARSWIITDTLGMALKKSNASDFRRFYLSFVKGKATFKKRFAYVQAMRYYREENITFFLDGLRYDESYYVLMGQAWMLATFAITHFDEIAQFLQKDGIPLSLKRKAISKMRDSYRISKEQKEILKRLRDNA